MQGQEHQATLVYSHQSPDAEVEQALQASSGYCNILLSKAGMICYQKAAAAFFKLWILSASTLKALLSLNQCW